MADPCSRDMKDEDVHEVVMLFSAGYPGPLPAMRPV